jgi:hypothetical protein
MYTGPGGGLYTGASTDPYMSNWPPREMVIDALTRMGMHQIANMLRKAWDL